MAGVVSRQSRLANADDTGNLDIANLNGPAGTASLHNDAPGGLGRSLVEGKHSIFKVLFERLREGLFQLTPAPACRRATLP